MFPQAFLLAALLSVTGLAHAAADQLSLAGNWDFSFSKTNRFNGRPALPAIEFRDTIQLPGTTDTRNKGPENTERRLDGLTRLHKYVGPAWYRRRLNIPGSWRGKSVTLFMEHTKFSRVWLDGRSMGENPTLCTPQEYELGVLAPGVYELTALIDNSIRPVPGENHQTSDNTQGNWNGILGRIELHASGPVSLADVQIYPDVSRKLIRVQVEVDNRSGQVGQGSLALNVAGPGRVENKGISLPVSWDSTGGRVETELALGKAAHLWDEFHPELYSLRATLQSAAGQDERTIRFGLREFKTQGTHFTINGRVTFLRGKHDACVFPLTGHPPMEVAGWRQYLGACQRYGINFIRFHTWTPPEAAFEAADELGIYLQPELPFWGKYNEKIQSALMPEARRILKCYGNHPSFVMFALGNECSGSREVMGAMIKQMRTEDDRHLYAQGSNNHFSNPQLAAGDDYWTTMRTGQGGQFNVRGSFATVDGGNGCVQIGPPCSTNDFAAALRNVPVPVIGHEVGQYTVFPNFQEISKYKGVFRARNLECFRDKLRQAGMLEQAPEFSQASGQLAALCYRQEVELALGTADLGGFDLLDLQDFPGQGTALVGLLDAFMDSKGIVTAKAWRESSAPVVLLARFERYTWTPAETFTALVQLANYGEKDFAQAVEWRLQDAHGHSLKSGQLPAVLAGQGGLRNLGRLEIALGDVPAPEKCTLELRLGGTDTMNHYPLWIYPARIDIAPPAGVALVHTWDQAALDKLLSGGRVMFVPETNSMRHAVGGGFATDFWNWAMFKNQPGTMGLLCQSKHPALAGFPSAMHSDWQWFHLLGNSQPVILDGVPLEPIVQVIDNMTRNHRLGLIFEARVGAGKLLVCTADIPESPGKPEARQLLRSLLDYVGSDAFNPKQTLTETQISNLLATGRLN